ncbi:MAG: serine hydrolase [Vicinamibacterales bacterium]
MLNLTINRAGALGFLAPVGQVGRVSRVGRLNRARRAPKNTNRGTAYQPSPIAAPSKPGMDQLTRTAPWSTFALFALIVASLGAQDESTLAHRVDELVTQVRTQHQIPGLSVAVVVNGARAYAKGFGSSSPTGTPAISSDTQFRLASVSKAFTAVANVQAGRAREAAARSARTRLLS